MASQESAARRSRVLVSQAVAEVARASAQLAVLRLADGLSAFNTTAQWALRRLAADLDGTHAALAASDWLAGKSVFVASGDCEPREKTIVLGRYCTIFYLRPKVKFINQTTP